MDAKPKIGLVTGITIFAGGAPILESPVKLVHVLEPLSDEITWVATNSRQIMDNHPEKVKPINIDSAIGGRLFFTKSLRYLWHQIKIALKIIKLREVKIVIFSHGSDLFALPILVARFLGKKVALRSSGRPSITVKRGSPKPSKYKVILLRAIEGLTYLLVNKIFIESQNMVKLYNLNKFQAKIYDGSSYTDTSLFKKTKELANRTYHIGYVGRFSEEKGVLEFAQSLPLILKDKQAKVIMIGDGDLSGEVKQILVNNNIQDKVKLAGWIENKELSSYLNNIRILVVPSYREGVPNIVLEAMACGTPVLATGVGGTPDLVKDGETGFIMEENSPQCIAKNVIKALNYPRLKQISENALALIEKKYTYEAAVERYSAILAD